MYRTILVPLDGSALSERALPLSTALAKATEARLVLVRAVSPQVAAGSEMGGTTSEQTREAEVYLEHHATRLAAKGLRVETAAPRAPAGPSILNSITRYNADLVVMTTHGRSGIGRWVYGSVAETVLRRSPVPVFLVRPWGPAPQAGFERRCPRILVPLDGSGFAETALPHAAGLARAINATLYLLHVRTPPPLTADPLSAQALFAGNVFSNGARAERYLSAIATPLRAKRVRVQTVVRTGNAVETILDEVWGSAIDLVVMTTHGRTGLNRLLLGSVGLEVLHRTAQPVLLIRPMGTDDLPSEAHAATELELAEAGVW